MNTDRLREYKQMVVEQCRMCDSFGGYPDSEGAWYECQDCFGTGLVINDCIAELVIEIERLKRDLYEINRGCQNLKAAPDRDADESNAAARTHGQESEHEQTIGTTPAQAPGDTGATTLEGR